MDLSSSETTLNISNSGFSSSNGTFFIDADSVDQIPSQLIPGEICESDIIKYFLNDDFQPTSDDFMLDSHESDSSEATPPQLTPESTLDFQNGSPLR